MENEFGDAIQRIDRLTHWDELVLPDEAIKKLREISSVAATPPTVDEALESDRRVPLDSGVVALFAGASGTGKTMAAEVVASELGLDLYRVGLSRVVNKYIGETEKNLNRLLEAAKGRDAILFFDEADALFGRRTRVKDSHDRSLKLLLARLEDHSRPVIFATENENDLPEALLKGCRFIVRFPPRKTARRLRNNLHRGSHAG